MQNIKAKILVFVIGLAVSAAAGLLALDSKEVSRSYCESIQGAK